MNHSNVAKQPRRLTALASLAVAGLLGAGLLAPLNVQADPRHDRGHRDDHGRRGPPPRHYGRGWGRPDVVYAPPPVVYRPEPSPGVSLFLPIEIH